ncbi:TonB-dependent receptor [Acidovorax sp. SUPP3434]|uniref:TonB-dependent receptor n=1 Tax=Acidovorax sp. SUPP3434 TaxID=2920880 RepID=UPI0023DE3E98|nr:TonB-dependent receptor [Acidovorax sp. SUPP3434]GKS98267.1 TonB-dependent receptor [Acidovorax sp. SUPP3434]
MNSPHRTAQPAAPLTARPAHAPAARRATLRPLAWAALLALGGPGLLPAVHAQAANAAEPAASASASAPTPTTPTAPAARLPEVTVTGNPLGAATVVAPAAQLSGDALTLRTQSTLGETLDGLPGVSSTYFGPNASRPIIRGLDGDRIRILQNSGATLDASALSFDHAVPTEALVTERIEVLRGPAALLYGGSAVGGVVNVIDNRIPREPINGVAGKAEAAAATGNGERSGGAMVEGGNDRYALHVDVFDRDTDDVRAPADLACEKPGSPGLARRICNSASHTRGGAVGGTVFFDRGYLGASASTYRNDYGTVAEDDVTIGMRSNRYALDGEWRIDAGPLQSIKMQASHTDYVHTEFEGGEAGTTFRNRGNDLRLEAKHAPLGALQGVIGLQAESSRFSAVGEEAFAPYSRSRSTALFAHEELATGWGKLTFGARTEQVSVESFGSADTDRFDTGKHTFHPHSAAVGALVNLAPDWQLTSNLSYTQRAPKDYELFANGPHIATGAWETGDSRLGLEKATSIDVGAAWKSGPQRFAVTAFYSRFSNYIGLTPTGASLTEDGERVPAGTDGALPEYRYQGVRAKFYGLEASGSVRLVGESGLAGATLFGDTASTLDLQLRGDLVRATNEDTGEPLPRIAPLRLGSTLAWASGPWRAGVGFDHLAAQDRVPSDGTRTTGAYTLWNASVGYHQQVQFGATRSNLLWYARLDNITDKLAYSATSILTTTAFPKSPLPGRSLKVGVKATF